MENIINPIGVPLAGGGEQCLATFLDRPNRFVAVVQLGDGTITKAHIADRGRLVETLQPGVCICLVARPGEKRATQWQAAAAQRADGSWASLDTLLPNRLMKRVLAAHLIPELPVYTDVRSEVNVGASRFDFVLTGGPQDIILEVKSAGRLHPDHTTASVPDAPNSRAARHVDELAALARQGQPTVLVVVAQATVTRTAIDGDIDPVLASAVRNARAAGVRVIGVSARFDRNGLYFEHTVPCIIHHSPNP
ncbi:MAG: DNA/RNA nuclease SfsA [Roseiflexaceae bacterium]